MTLKKLAKMKRVHKITPEEETITHFWDYKQYTYPQKGYYCDIWEFQPDFNLSNIKELTKAMKAGRPPDTYIWICDDCVAELGLLW